MQQPTPHHQQMNASLLASHQQYFISQSQTQSQTQSQSQSQPLGMFRPPPAAAAAAAFGGASNRNSVAAFPQAKTMGFYQKPQQQQQQQQQQHPPHSLASAATQHSSPAAPIASSIAIDALNAKPNNAYKKRNDSRKRLEPSSNDKATAKQTTAKQILADENGVKKQKSQFLCQVEYMCSLPQISFDPKPLTIHLDPERLLRFCAYELERSIKPSMPVGPTMGMKFELIDTDHYLRPDGIEKNKLAAEDAALFVNDVTLRQRQLPTLETEDKQRTFAWLRKGGYLENNLSTPQPRVPAHPVVPSPENKVNVDDAGTKHQMLIERILDSFKGVHETNQHPLHRNAKIIDSFEVLPFENLKNNFAVVEFDQNPFENQKNAEGCLYMCHNEGDIGRSSNVGLYLPVTTASSTNSSSDLSGHNVEHSTIGDQTFEWQREYNNLPTAPVKTNNNFILFQNGPQYQYICYSSKSRYSRRVANVKNNSLDDLSTRPATLRIKTVSCLLDDTSSGDKFADSKR